MSNKEKIYCDQCSSEMKCIHKSTVQKRKIKVRKRRFECKNTACKHQMTIYGDGYRDLELEPYLAAKEGAKFADDLNQN
jgi:hypothetical protein